MPSNCKHGSRFTLILRDVRFERVKRRNEKDENEEIVRDNVKLIQLVINN